MSAILTTILSANSDAQIGGAIESVRGWVDGVLLVDTGITDRTREVAGGILGGRLVVQAFSWCGDFAAARNFAPGAIAGLPSSGPCDIVRRLSLVKKRMPLE